MALPLVDDTPLNAQSLQAKLMSPQAIERVRALHALERLLPTVTDPRAARELDDFVARGIPYFAPHEAAYCQWVAQAVGHWERLQGNARPEPALASALG